MNLGQVDAEHAVQRGTHIKGEAIRLFGPMSRRRYGSRGRFDTRLQVSERDFNSLTTL